MKGHSRNRIKTHAAKPACEVETAENSARQGREVNDSKNILHKNCSFATTTMGLICSKRTVVKTPSCAGHKVVYYLLSYSRFTSFFIIKYMAGITGRDAYS